MDTRAHQKKPCKQCPFRRESMPGWLGAGSPERFALAILAEDPLPCHSTIDYEDPHWHSKFTGERNDEGTGLLCAGALIQSANVCKMPRDPRIPRFVADKETVFKTVQEFIDHHRSRRMKSWDETEDRKGLKAWVKLKSFGIPMTMLAEMDEDET